jgi:hypothetical protein
MNEGDSQLHFDQRETTTAIDDSNVLFAQHYDVTKRNTS